MGTLCLRGWPGHLLLCHLRMGLIFLTFFPDTSMAAQKRAVKIGDPAPDFCMQSLDGRTIRLSDYRGKRVLLFVWASW